MSVCLRHTQKIFSHPTESSKRQNSISAAASKILNQEKKGEEKSDYKCERVLDLYFAGSGPFKTDINTVYHHLVGIREAFHDLV